MKSFYWIDWAILALIAFLMFLIASGATVASEPQVTLTPGTWRIIEFTNAENEQENLAVANISAPDVLLPYIVVSPEYIPPLSSENITVQFAYVPATIRESVPQDIFAVQVDGLIVYLDLSVPLPENAENRWATLEDQISAFQASFTEQIGGLTARITALETAPEPEWENLMPEIENLAEGTVTALRNFHAWVENRIAEIDATSQENSPPTDTSWWQTALGDMENRLRREYELSANQLRMDYEEGVAKAKSDAERTALIYSALLGVAILGGVGGYLKIRKFEGASKRRSRGRVAGDEKGQEKLKPDSSW